jgi:hypothetical protein
MSVCLSSLKSDLVLYRRKVAYVDQSHPEASQLTFALNTSQLTPDEIDVRIEKIRFELNDKSTDDTNIRRIVERIPKCVVDRAVTDAVGRVKDGRGIHKPAHARTAARGIISRARLGGTRLRRDNFCGSLSRACAERLLRRELQRGTKRGGLTDGAPVGVIENRVIVILDLTKRCHSVAHMLRNNVQRGALQCNSSERLFNEKRLSGIRKGVSTVTPLGLEPRTL